MTLEDIKRFLTSPHVLHMEKEIDYLRGQNAKLQLELKEALTPRQPSVAPPRQFPTFVQPQKTSWEQYRDDEIARQEKEENGISK